MRRLHISFFSFLFVFVLFLSTSFSNIHAEEEVFQNNIEYNQYSDYHNFFKDRMSYIIRREYSISHLKKIWIGIVNYPQWFVGLSLGNHLGLTFNGKIKGSESLYPTNITHERWLFNFNSSSQKMIEDCSRRLKGWTDNDQLELVLYSQAMNICLSSPHDKLLKHSVWYSKCWVRYHKFCIEKK